MGAEQDRTAERMTQGGPVVILRLPGPLKRIELDEKPRKPLRARPRAERHG